jgi:TIR domain-containing protein/WD40 domain-containing protein
VRYRAFISYSRKDRRVVKILHRALERFRVPTGVNSGDVDRRLGRFFRDDDELRASEHLGAALNGAIDDSKDLIVVASPDAAQSTWVNKEILRFKRRGAARVFAVIVRGSPNSDDADTECFPPALKYRVDSDGAITTDPADPPLAANLTEESFARGFIRLVAGLLDVDFDALWQRERRRARQRRTIVGASAGMALAVAILVAANGVTANDISALRDRSVEISTEQWRYFREGREFDPAFRAALAAARLDRPGPGERWALNVRSDATSRAIALSGRALPLRPIFGQYPDISTRSNYRDDIPNADPAQRVAIHAQVNVRGLCFSGDSNRLGLAVSNGQVLVYNVAAGTEKYSSRFEGVDAGSRIALDESGRTALVGARNRLYFIEIDPGIVKTCLTPELQRFHEIGRLANRWVFTAARDGGAVVGEFDPGSCQITQSVEIPEFTPYNSNAFSTGETMFVGYDSWHGLTPVLADFRKGPTIKFDDLGFGVGQVKVIATEPTRGLVALGGNGSGGGARAGVQLVSLERSSEASRLVGHTGEIYAVDFMPQSDLIVTGGSDFSVRLWNLRTGNELMRLASHLGDIYSTRFSPDGKLLATSSSDGMVLLWDVSPVRELRRRPLWEFASERQAGLWQRPSTIVTSEERQTTAAFQGRPWDVLEWRDPSTPGGAIQSVRAMFVRSFGWSLFDYARPK